MFKSKTMGLCFALVVTLGACAQQAEPIHIQAEPIFNKFGDVTGCSSGVTPSHNGDVGTSIDGIDQVNPCMRPPEDPGKCGFGSYRPHPLSPCIKYDDDDNNNGGTPTQPVGTGPTGGPSTP